MIFIKSYHFSNRVQVLFLGCICLFFMLFILLPLMAIFLNLNLNMMAIQLKNPKILSALTVGLVTSLSATFTSIFFGVPTGYLLATRRIPGKVFIDTILDIPLVLPPAVAGLALLLAFAPRGILGPILQKVGIILPGSMLAVVLAQMFVASPFILRSSRTAFENVDKKLIDSAKLLTHSRLRIFFTVTLPLSSHGIIAGTIMSWARSMGEFGATLLFAGNLPGITQTMPLAIYMLMAEDPLASNVLSAILVGVSFFVLVVFRLLGHKKYGARV